MKFSIPHTDVYMAPAHTILATCNRFSLNIKTQKIFILVFSAIGILNLPPPPPVREAL